MFVIQKFLIRPIFAISIASLIPMRLRVCLYLLVFGLPLPLFAATPSLDLRVLIDTSSRFAELDPDGNRGEVLRLLTGLLPDGAAGGAWTYGRYVEQVAPPGRVDAAWRERALAGAERIHANAGYADLEHALGRALEGWQTPASNQRRVLLLISASGVEPADDESLRAASRQRVIGEKLAALAATGVELHAVTIGDGADRGLFERLAFATGGTHRHAPDARGLVAQAGDFFSRAMRSNQLVLADERFSVDAHVDALTLVLLREPGSKAPLLIPPDSPVISAARPRGARWQASRDFDLVHLRRPEAGDWQVVAKLANDSRLLMTSKLELRAGVTPSRAWPGEPLEIAAELYRGGKKIRRNAFLRFVEFGVTLTGPDDEAQRLALRHSEVRSDKGRYLLTLDEPLAEGRHRLRVEARGSSFHRVQELEALVGWPVEIRIEAAAEPGQYDFRLRAREAQLRVDGLAADVEIETPKGKREALLLQPDSGWLHGRIVTGVDGAHQARVRVSGRRHDDSVVDLNLGPFALLGAASQVEAGLAAPPPPPPEPIAAEPAGFDRKLIGIVILSVNAMLLFAVLAIWLYTRRKRRLAAAAEEAEVIADEGTEPAPADGGDDSAPTAEQEDVPARTADGGDAAVVSPVEPAGENPATGSGDEVAEASAPPADGEADGEAAMPPAAETDRKSASG